MALITKKLYLVPVIVLIFCFGFAQRAYAAETTIESVADMFGLEEIDSELSDLCLRNKGFVKNHCQNRIGQCFRRFVFNEENNNHNNTFGIA